MYLKKDCVHCGGEATRQQYTHTEEFAGVRVSDPRSQAYVCARCGQPELSLDALAGLQRRAAMVALQDLSAVKGGVLKYARKAAGLRQVDLAKLLGTRGETISRAETSEGTIDRTLQVAMLGILQQMECGVSLGEMLEKVDRPVTEEVVDLVAPDAQPHGVRAA